MNWKENFYKTKVKPYEKYEKEAAERVAKLYKVEIFELFNKNNGNKYDFVDSNNIKYEVKFDRYSLKSGNFFIEYFGYCKLSGISITEANYYIITDEQNYYLISVKKLKKICEKNGYEKRTKDNLTRGYCIQKEFIIKNSQII